MTTLGITVNVSRKYLAMFSNLTIILSVTILIVVMLSVGMLKEIMLDILAKCYYSEFCYSKCYSVLLAGCRLL
jgi:hypothetical protein